MLLFNTLYIIIICYINISFQQLLCPVVIVTHNLSHNAQKHTVHNNTPLLHHHHHHHFYYYFIIYYFFTIIIIIIIIITIIINKQHHARNNRPQSNGLQTPTSLWVVITPTTESPPRHVQKGRYIHKLVYIVHTY